MMKWLSAFWLINTATYNSVHQVALVADVIVYYTNSSIPVVSDMGAGQV